MQKQLVLKWLAVALVIVISWAPFTFAGFDENDNEIQSENVVDKRRQQSCDPRRLYECKDFVRGGQEEEEEEEEVEVVVMVEEERPSKRCCQKLRRMPQRCRCDAIQRMLDQTQREREEDNERGRHGQSEQEQQQMQMQLQRARQLPQRCNVDSPTRCDIQQRRAAAAYLSDISMQPANFS